MQKYLTLDEAAKLLQMSPDELREMAKKKTIRAFQDRGSWRFRSQDIEELARTRGLSSDAELQLGEAVKPKAKEQSKAPVDPDLLPTDFSLDDSDEVPIGREKPASSGPRSAAGKSGPRSPKPGSDSDVRLVMEEGMTFAPDSDSDVRLDPADSKSGKKRGGSSATKKRDESSESDVNLGAAKEKSHSDSDIRLDEVPSPDRSSRSTAQGPITEEIDLDAEEIKLPPAPKKQRPSKPTQMAGKGGLPTDSPFELSEPDLNLDIKPKPSKPTAPRRADDSDFELIPFDASKSPVELGSGEIPLLQGDEEVSLGSEVSGTDRGNSGINLKEPIDSGISLEDGGSDEIEFDLSLDAGSTPKPQARSATRKPAEPTPEDDSSSEFDLSLDDGSPTDGSSSEFELSLDDEGATADSSSEFELSLDESGSEVSDDNSDSEFELTLDDEGSLAVDEEAGDIFEETNFDVPALEDESGSEAVALDENDTDLEGSDFEISLDDSAAEESSDSQVVALEDEEADDAAATVAKPRKTASKSKAAPLKGDVSGDDLDLDLDDEPAPKSKKRKQVEEDDEDFDEDDDEAGSPVVAAVAPDWGPFPAVMLFPTVIVMFVVGIMGFELMRGMFGYHRPSVVGKPLIDNIARQFDESLPK